MARPVKLDYKGLPRLLMLHLQYRGVLFERITGHS